MKVYEALYNPMTEESSYGTLSVHLTSEGAQKVIDEHREREFADWTACYPFKEDEPYPFGEFQDWQVNEVEVLE